MHRSFGHHHQGENEVDEDDVMDILLDQQARAASASLPRGGALSAVRSTKVTKLPDAAVEASGFSLGDLAKRLLGKSRGAGGSFNIPSGPVAEGVHTLASSPRGVLGGQELSGAFSPIRKASSKTVFDLREAEAQVWNLV